MAHTSCSQDEGAAKNVGGAVLNWLGSNPKNTTLGQDYSLVFLTKVRQFVYV